MNESDPKIASQSKTNTASNLWLSRLFWGLIFVVLTIIGFSYNTLFTEGILGCLWTIVWWAALIFTIWPESAKKVSGFFLSFLRSLDSSKKHLPVFKKFFSKTFAVLFVAIIGWFLVQWIMSSASGVRSEPLSQLTLSDLTGFIGSIIISLIVVFICYRLIAAIVADK